MIIHRLPLVGLLAALLCAPSLTASAQDLFGNIFKPPGATQDAERERAEQTELVTRMDRLENGLRQLTGQVEQLQFRNQQLEAEIRRLGGNVPGPAATGTVSAPTSITPRPPAVAATSNGRRSDAFDPSAQPGAPGVPQALGSPTSSAANLPSAGETQVASIPGASASPRELYEAGQAQLMRQDYAGAEETFRQIIQAHGNDKIVPDATFMLGETFFLRQKYEDAAAFFLDVFNKYPNSARAPEALLRVGQSLAGFGDKEHACVTFQEVDRKYPRMPSSLRQAVEREQKRVGC